MLETEEYSERNFEYIACNQLEKCLILAEIKRSRMLQVLSIAEKENRALEIYQSEDGMSY